MGYQETWLHIKPQNYVQKYLNLYIENQKKPDPPFIGAEPVAVVVLKQEINNLPKGTTIIWVCGDREFHTEEGTFGEKLRLPPFSKCELDFIPVEDIIEKSSFNILFDIEVESDELTENSFIKHYSLEDYCDKFLNNSRTLNCKSTDDIER